MWMFKAIFLNDFMICKMPITKCLFIQYLLSNRTFYKF